MTARFGQLTERELDIAEHVFRRTLVAYSRTLKIVAAKSPGLRPQDIGHYVVQILENDPEARELIRADLEKAKS